MSKSLKEIIYFDTFVIFSIVSFRIVKVSNFHIQKIVNPYSIFGVINLMYAYLTPVLERKRHLPYPMYVACISCFCVAILIILLIKENSQLRYVPLGIDQTNFGFCMAYAYQLGNVIYVGGINIAVNMYLFDAFVCVNFFLSLLSSRICRLGYPSKCNESYTKTPSTRKSFYHKVCQSIELHLKIDRFVNQIKFFAS